MKKEVVAMLLAGGQGSRLYVLTGKVAKPAIPFGGKYRIIDFPLSNCVNSGIDTVGVLTQYQPLELNSYIGSGQPWDLDGSDGGVHILPPYVSQGDQGTWYKGTANAIYQNIGFIDLYEPEYVVILSGDHIYKMDYAKMVNRHKESGAACTISVMEVPWDEAPRFGIMNVDEEDGIVEFEEKPSQPKSNLASMGIYCFSWKELRHYLIEDEKERRIPRMISEKILFPICSETARKWWRTALPDTGKMWVRWTVCGTPIWICWPATVGWMYSTANGRSMPVRRAKHRPISVRGPW